MMKRAKIFINKINQAYSKGFCKIYEPMILVGITPWM